MPKAPLKIVSKPASAVIDIAPAANVSLPASWEKARRFVELTSLHLAASCAAQVLAGMELLALHKAYNMKPGKRTDLSHDVRGWKDAVKEEIGVSEMTAWRWMEMAKVARPRLLKDHTDLGALLLRPPSDLTQAEREALQRAVHKITDGQTQSELMLEWGITKKGGGSPTGGNLGKGTPALTNGEDGTVPADVVWWAKHLPDLNLELCVRSSWAKLPIKPEDCPRANLTTLRDMLAAALEAINAHMEAHS